MKSWMELQGSEVVRGELLASGGQVACPTATGWEGPGGEGGAPHLVSWARPRQRPGLLLGSRPPVVQDRGREGGREFNMN